MAVMIDYSKLRILPDPDTREWWEAARQHKYLVRQCNRCGHKWFPPNIPACDKCTTMDIGWFETAGKGVIHSYVVVVQPIVGAFVSSCPLRGCDHRARRLQGGGRYRHAGRRSPDQR